MLLSLLSLLLLLLLLLFLLLESGYFKHRNLSERTFLNMVRIVKRYETYFC